MAMMIVTWTEDVQGDGEDGDGWINRKAVSLMRVGEKVRMIVAVNGEELTLDMGKDELDMVQSNISHMRWSEGDANLV